MNIDVPLRSYRRQMKPILPRKVTAAARINLNKFWNDLEEFYNRYDDRRASNNNNPLVDIKTVFEALPAYTTDTYDHDREAAENDLNERLESGKFDDSTYFSYSSSVASYDEDSGAEDFDLSPNFSPSSTPKFGFWHDLEARMAPRNLPELFKRVNLKH